MKPASMISGMAVSLGGNVFRSRFAWFCRKIWKTITNDFGCTGNTQTEVILLPCDMDIPIPNAFRPTSNIIENQTFKPVFGPVVPLTYHLQIYNRWGNLVFETRDYRQGWDGRYNGGDAPSGAYVWVLRYTNEGEAAPVEKTLKGTVTLIR